MQCLICCDAKPLKGSLRNYMTLKWYMQIFHWGKKKPQPIVLSITTKHLLEQQTPVCMRQPSEIAFVTNTMLHSGVWLIQQKMNKGISNFPKDLFWIKNHTLYNKVLVGRRTKYKRKPKDSFPNKGLCSFVLPLDNGTVQYSIQCSVSLSNIYNICRIFCCYGYDMQKFSLTSTQLLVSVTVCLIGAAVQPSQMKACTITPPFQSQIQKAAVSWLNARGKFEKWQWEERKWELI